MAFPLLNRRKQTDSRCNQRFRDTRRHHLQRRLFHRTEGDKRVHNPPYRTKQTNIRNDGTHGAEERNVRL